MLTAMSFVRTRTLAAVAFRLIIAERPSGAIGPLRHIARTMLGALLFGVAAPVVHALRAQTPVVVNPKNESVMISGSVTTTRTFSVINLSTSTRVFNLGVSCTGTLSLCSPNTPSITLGAYVTGQVTVTFRTGAPGTGVLTLIATWQNDPIVTDRASLYVTAAPAGYLFAVTPKGTSWSVATGQNWLAFTIANTGSNAATFNLSSAL